MIIIVLSEIIQLKSIKYRGMIPPISESKIIVIKVKMTNDLTINNNFLSLKYFYKKW